MIAEMQPLQGGVIPRISPRTTQLTTVAVVEDNTPDQTETPEAGQSLDQCFKRSLEEK